MAMSMFHSGDLYMVGACFEAVSGALIEARCLYLACTFAAGSQLPAKAYVSLALLPDLGV